MDLRERFERDCPGDKERCLEGDYRNPYQQSAWEGYQAGHAARDGEVAELRAKVEAAEKNAALGAAIYAAIKDIPEEFNLTIDINKMDNMSVSTYDAWGDPLDVHCDGTDAEYIKAHVDAAIDAARES